MEDTDPDMKQPGKTLEPDADLWDAEQRRAGSERARGLRVQAAEAGLHFQAYLPPELATWMLDLIERGVFTDPSEAAFVLLGEMRELFGHPDLRKDLLARGLEAAARDPRPPIPAEVVFAEIDAILQSPRPVAANWDCSVTHINGEPVERTE